MIAFQKDLASFGKRNAQVLGVSGDSLDTHQAFAGEHGISFPLIDDGDGAIRKLFGGGRITYIIDKAGTIRFALPGVPNNRQLLGELDKLANP